MGDLGGLEMLGLRDLPFRVPEGRSAATRRCVLMFSKWAWPSWPFMFRPVL